MTQEKKDKLNGLGNVLYKFMVTSLLTLILIQTPSLLKDIDSRAFETVDDRINTKNHINNSLNPFELKDLQEHISNPDFHMPKHVKDSLYLTRHEYDEFVKRLAITNYQTKEEVKEVKLLLSAIMDKIDNQ